MWWNKGFRSEFQSVKSRASAWSLFSFRPTVFKIQPPNDEILFFTLAFGTSEVYFPEDALVIVDIIVNQPRVDDSSEGEEDKLLFALKLDLYSIAFFIFFSSLNIGPTLNKNFDAKNTDANPKRWS